MGTTTIIGAHEENSIATCAPMDTILPRDPPLHGGRRGLDVHLGPYQPKLCFDSRVIVHYIQQRESHKMEDNCWGSAGGPDFSKCDGKITPPLHPRIETSTSNDDTDRLVRPPSLRGSKLLQRLPPPRDTSLRRVPITHPFNRNAPRTSLVHTHNKRQLRRGSCHGICSSQQMSDETQRCVYKASPVQDYRPPTRIYKRLLVLTRAVDSRQGARPKYLPQRLPL